MAESSVDSYINAQPQQAMTLDDWWFTHGGNNENIDSIGNRFMNFFSGHTSKAKREYQTYLDNLNNQNEYVATQSARSWDKMLDDTTYQRMMKDFEAAGLNPYLLINNGGMSAASGRTTGKADYKYSKADHEAKKTGKGRDFALMLLAAARIAAALL